MKPHLFYIKLTGLSFTLIVYALFASFANQIWAQNIDEPTITTQIYYGSGAEVTIAYESKYWIGSRNIPDPQSLMNNYSEEMAMMENNAQLQIGPTKLDPGIYWIGFAPIDENTWELVIKTQAGDDLSRLPIVMRVEPNIVDYLSIVLRPGKTDQDFIMTMLYGSRSTSLRWTFIGIPLRESEPQSPSSLQPPDPQTTQSQNIESTPNQNTIPDLAPTPVNSAATINNMSPERSNRFNPASSGTNINAMTQAAPPLKKRAGSGSFRRLIETYQKEQKGASASSR